MSTIQKLLRDCSLPQLEARMLMQFVTGWSRASLISRGLDELPEAQTNAFDKCVVRRIAGEPMAYIIGEREFYGRIFKVSEAVLIPRPDTEVLIEAVLERFADDADKPLNIIDLGTGSGAIAITLACERPAWRVSALDVSLDALTVAKANAAALGAFVTFYESDWLAVFENQTPQPIFDLIVSNPPYIAAEDEHLSQGDVRFEPSIALSDHSDGLTNYIKLVQTVPNYLVKGGQLWFEHGYDQGEAVRRILTDAGFTEVTTIHDLSGNERISGGVRPA